ARLALRYLPGVLPGGMAGMDLETERCPSTPKVIRFLSCLLQRVSDSNDSRISQFAGSSSSSSQQSSTTTISIFHGLTPPTISIHSYLERIFNYANCSPSCFVVAYVYLNRFVQKQPCLPITSLNVHRLLITSVLVSVKFMDDIYYNNAYYAKVGGISRAEMNLMEVDFLFGIGFDLNVTPTTFHTYCSHLHTQMTILQSPPLQLSHQTLKNMQPQDTAATTTNRSTSKLHHCCYNEELEEESAQHQQLAV
ncbi:CYCU4-1, partial [Linum perenne]